MQAQDYPARPIRLIVPIGPGGGTDILARHMAQKMTERLRSSVVVENRPGAGSIIGTDYVAKAPPDGYTLLVGGIFNMVMNKALVKNLPYEPLRDFVPLGYISAYPFALVARPDLPATLPDRRQHGVPDPQGRDDQGDQPDAGEHDLHHVHVPHDVGEQGLRRDRGESELADPLPHRRHVGQGASLDHQGGEVGRAALRERPRRVGLLDGDQEVAGPGVLRHHSYHGGPGPSPEGPARAHHSRLGADGVRRRPQLQLGSQHLHRPEPRGQRRRLAAPGDPNRRLR